MKTLHNPALSTEQTFDPPSAQSVGDARSSARWLRKERRAFLLAESAMDHGDYDGIRGMVWALVLSVPLWAFMAITAYFVL